MGTSAYPRHWMLQLNEGKAQSGCKASFSLIMNRSNSRDCGLDFQKSLDLPDTITNPAPKDSPTKYKAGVNPMSDWKTRYASKLVTAKEAASYVQNGDRIFLSGTCCEPTAIIEALGDFHTGRRGNDPVHTRKCGRVTGCQGSSSFQIENLLSRGLKCGCLWNIRGRLRAAFPFANPGFFQGQANSH